MNNVHCRNCPSITDGLRTEDVWEIFKIFAFYTIFSTLLSWFNKEESSHFVLTFIIVIDVDFRC